MKTGTVGKTAAVGVKDRLTNRVSAAAAATDTPTDAPTQMVLMATRMAGQRLRCADLIA